MSGLDFSLEDLLDINDLQQLQDDFASVSGVAVMLVDSYNNILTRQSKGFSAKIDQTKQASDEYLTAIKKLCVENRRTRTTATVTCPDTGLKIASIPMFLDKEHLGSWIIQQPEIEETAKEKVGENEQSQTQPPNGVFETTILTKGAFENVHNYFQTLSRTLIEMVQTNYNLKQNNENLIELTEQLDNTAQMLSKFTNSAKVGMYVTDFFTGEILQANEHFSKYLGKSIDQLIGQKCWFCFDPVAEEFCEDCPHGKLLDDKGYPSKPIVWERYEADRDLWLQLTNQAIYWVDGRLAHMVTFIDITSTKQMQNKLSRLAFYDQAMQLPNSLKFVKDIETEGDISKTHLICFDIVSLRTINDIYSRDAGDLLLLQISQWINSLELGKSCLYRIDGDEFCLSLQDTNSENALKIANLIYRRFEESWGLEVGEEKIYIFCNLSLGVVHLTPDRHFSGDELLNIFERTLSAAREDGKIALYNHTMDEQYKQRLTLGIGLKSCVKQGMKGFEVYYQPIINPITRMWCGLEALCRWKSPQFGSIGPIIFIREAEQLGLIGIIGKWVLEESVKQCKEWELDKIDDFILDVNLSPVQLSDELLVGNIFEILKRYDYPADKLSLEITESTEITFSSHTMNAIERLQKANIKVALDDFGTGYSSFNNLKQLPITTLKTERAFLNNIENDEYLQHLVYMMVELAHTANINIIAEGVETQEQMQILLKNGVDLLQGYFFGKPMPAKELEKNIKNFTQECEWYTNKTKSRIDLDCLRENTSEIKLTSNVNELLSSCMLLLLSPIDTDSAIEQAFELVCNKFLLDRAYVLWNDGQGNLKQSHSWSAAGEEEPFAKTFPITLFENASIWKPYMQDNWMYTITDTTTLKGEIAQTMFKLNMKAAAAVPIWRGSTLQGIIGFSDCKTPRNWTRQEMLLLHNLSLVISSAFLKQEHTKNNHNDSV